MHAPKKFTSISVHLLLRAMFSILIGACLIQGQTDDQFHWYEPALELDQLLFKKSYIDSVKVINNADKIQTSLRQIKNNPFAVAETLVYDIAWGPIKAGFVVLTSEPDIEKGTIRIGGKAMTNDFVSAFFKLRDYVTTTIDANGLYPIFFEQHLREGKKYKQDGYTLFDHIDRKVYVQEKKFKVVENVPQFVHDYMSALYHVRSLNHAPGDTFTLSLFADAKVHTVLFKVKQRETIQVDAGKFKCILIEPKLVGNGRAFNKKDKIEIYLTDDEQCTPVFIRSKLKAGSVTAKLVWRSSITETAKK